MRTFVVVLCFCLLIGLSDAGWWRRAKHAGHKAVKGIGKGVGKAAGKVKGAVGKAAGAVGKVVGGIAGAGKYLLKKLFGDTDKLVQKLKEMDDVKYDAFMRDLDNVLQEEVSKDVSAEIINQLHQEVKRDSVMDKEFDALEELRKQIE